MKNYLLIDSDGHANGVIKTSNFNISHYPGNTYVEVDNTISHIVAQNTENIKIINGHINQIKNKRDLWSHLKDKGQESTYLSQKEDTILNEPPNTSNIDERVDIKPNLYWDVPTGEDLNIIIQNGFTKQQVFDMMNQNMLVMKWNDAILAIKTSIETIPLSKERADWFFTDTRIIIPSRNTTYTVGDLYVQQGSNANWVIDNLNASNWSRKDLAIREIESWLYLDDALVLNGYKNGVLVDCCIIRHGKDTQLDYTKPFSINYLLTKMSFDEAKTMRHLFYKWMSSAGYVNATMYIDERIFNSLISCIDTKVLVNPVDPTKIQLDLAKVQLWKDSITYIGTNVGSRIVVIPNPIQRNLDIFENNN